MTTETVTKRTRPKRDRCDNHPDIDATTVTDGNGAHQTIHLCDYCSARLRRVR